MDRKKALDLLKKYVKNKNLIRHSLAVEAVMRALCQHFGKTSEIDKWALSGLLHDMDWEMTKNDPRKHGVIAAEILEKEGYDSTIAHAVKAHNHLINVPLENLMEKTLFCAEELTGLITACALVNPQKLTGVKASSVKKKFKQPSFARGVNRAVISQAPELIGLSLDELIVISLEAMKKIKDQLGL